jgi:hypothetical protein
LLLDVLVCEQTVTNFRWRLRSVRRLLTAFFSRSPRSQTTKGGEPMMMATLMIGATGLAAMVAGYVAMARD